MILSSLWTLLSGVALALVVLGSAEGVRPQLIIPVSSDGVMIPATPTPVVIKETKPPETPSPLGWGGEVTHYGVSFEGLTMACGGVYHTWDTSIVAVPYPSRNSEWPCGQPFTITGPTGSITAYRTDSCPGCHHYQLDLSEAGMLAVCGYLGRCEVWIRPH